jgi:hypothetical protein
MMKGGLHRGMEPMIYVTKSEALFLYCRNYCGRSGKRNIEPDPDETLDIKR